MAAASYLTIGEDDGWLLHYLLRKAEEKGTALAQRTWCLGSSVTEPFAVNNGLCEGDPLSVVGVISIGFLWVQSIREHDAVTDINAYADNWSWASIQPAAHGQVALCTKQITALAGMIIDWQKSWIWSTKPTQLAHLKTAIQAIAGPIVLRQLLHEMELGCIMNYRGCHRLGKNQQRLNEAKRRLKILMHMQHDSQTKTHLVRAAVYAQVAYGTELTPLGTNHTDQLRSQICEGVLGPSHSRNSALAIAALPNLMDPEVYITHRAIKAAKRYLPRATPQESQAFLHDVATHSGTWSHCKGPAGSLKCYLLRQGWLIDSHGHIQVTAFIRISLVHTGLKPQLARTSPTQVLQPKGDPRGSTHGHWTHPTGHSEISGQGSTTFERRTFGSIPNCSPTGHLEWKWRRLSPPPGAR